MCLASPVAERAYHDDSVRFGGAVSFLGICASAQHSADCHTSGHNCAATCGGQESPVNGVRYDPRYCHGLDTKINGNIALGYEIVNARVHDPRVRYCIFRGVLYFGLHYKPGPNGTVLTQPASGHPDHVHTSFLPGTTFDTSPFYQGITDPQEDLTIMDTATENYLDRHFLATAVLVKKESERNLQAEWRTRTLLREAGVIPKDGKDESEVKAALDKVQAELAELESRLADIGGPPNP